ncbi:DUF3397 family protein [Lacticaseibacillus paracasei]|uniref:DUF3397 domain-containing protein n=1 Tax=Lacticaseibacillus paracasei subsp. paracasei Lpp71 TaxID=1256207 RepID=A0A8E0MFJ2_LACPA|nr:DUF3397 family protein [Lacticaseibacillus paracasei]ALX88684.1 hypothetical protein AWC33_05465 [Lacticaseibacillus paracasei]EPC76929.1 hypothetical protein Lpp71_03061 [Lacticaseibacillus paracasei subsp. paracasei Lpp71]MDY0838102.1 DUF3397 family protein [Lacticaseibacillus paracasei]
MVLLAMGLPILVWLVVVAAVVQFDFHGGSWFCLLAIVNFGAIFKLTFTKTPNFIWVILFTTMVIALILVIWQVVREYDLIVRRYWRMLTRVLALATTCWWMAGVLIFFLG